MENKNFTIICPCCEANLIVDAQTGAVLSHEEKKKQLGSFDAMLKGLDKQKETREKLFEQELNAQKDRERLLEEKFQAAFKRADETKDQPYINPLDLD
ncbi:MAG: 2-nitropropane dioxygenase [Pyrinomonadaceae bacterium]